MPPKRKQRPKRKRAEKNAGRTVAGPHSPPSPHGDPSSMEIPAAEDYHQAYVPWVRAPGFGRSFDGFGGTDSGQQQEYHHLQSSMTDGPSFDLGQEEGEIQVQQPPGWMQVDNHTMMALSPNMVIAVAPGRYLDNPHGEYPQHADAPQAPQYDGAWHAHQYGGDPQPPQYGGTPQSLQYDGDLHAHQYGGDPQAQQYGCDPQAQHNIQHYVGDPQAHQYGGNPQAHQHGGNPQAHHHGGNPQANYYGGDQHAFRPDIGHFGDNHPFRHEHAQYSAPARGTHDTLEDHPAHELPDYHRAHGDAVHYEKDDGGGGGDGDDEDALEHYVGHSGLNDGDRRRTGKRGRRRKSARNFGGPSHFAPPSPMDSSHSTAASPPVQSFPSSHESDKWPATIDELSRDVGSRIPRITATSRKDGSTSFVMADAPSTATNGAMDLVGKQRLSPADISGNNSNNDELLCSSNNLTGEIRLPRPQTEIDQLRHAILAKNFGNRVDGRRTHQQETPLSTPLSPPAAVRALSTWPKPGEPLRPNLDGHAHARALQQHASHALAPCSPAVLQKVPQRHQLEAPTSAAAARLLSSTATARSAAAKVTRRISSGEAAPEGWRRAAGTFRKGLASPPVVAAPFLKAAESDASEDETLSPDAAALASAAAAAEQIRAFCATTKKNIAEGLSTAAAAAQSRDMLAAKRQSSLQQAASSPTTKLSQAVDGREAASREEACGLAKQAGMQPVMVSPHLPPAVRAELSAPAQSSSPVRAEAPASFTKKPLAAQVVAALPQPPKKFPGQPSISAAASNDPLVSNGELPFGVAYGGGGRVTMAEGSTVQQEDQRATTTVGRNVPANGAVTASGEAGFFTKSHGHALVLLGAATAVMPRGTLDFALKIPGARWVARYELRDLSNLPPDINPAVAKALADRLPSCVSVDDNEAGLEFLLLMTFVSASDKVAAVNRLAELRVDTSDFDNSSRIQVEQLRAAPAPPCTPAPPVERPTPPAPATVVHDAAVVTSTGAQNRIVANGHDGEVDRAKAGGNALEEQLRRKLQQEVKAKRLTAAAAAVAAAAVPTSPAKKPKESTSNTLEENANLSSKLGVSPAGSVAKAASKNESPKGSGIRTVRRAAEKSVDTRATSTGEPEASVTAAGSSQQPADAVVDTGAAPAPTAAQPSTVRAPAITRLGTVKGATDVHSAGSRSLSPVPPRTPSPVPQPKTGAPALATFGSDGRGKWPTRRTSEVAKNAVRSRSATFVPTDGLVPALKAHNRRLVVTVPSAPDPTRRTWAYGFSGPFFKFLEQDPKTGELLFVDRAKNASYVGVIPASEVVIAGLREVGLQNLSLAEAGATVAGAHVASALPTAFSAATAAVTAALDGSTSSSSSTAGSEGLDASGVVVLSKVCDPVTVSTSTTSSGKDCVAAAGADDTAAAALARGGLDAEKGELLLPPAVTGGVAGGVNAARQIEAVGKRQIEAVGKNPTKRCRENVLGGEGKRPLPRGELGARISKSEEELRDLQEKKIPRVMEALTDVSKRRRNLEALVVSVAAKSADANARLAQDSRDAASALMAELRARREATEIVTAVATKESTEKQSHQQQHSPRRAGGDRNTTVSETWDDAG